MISAIVSTRGALWNGVLQHAVHAAVDEIKQEVANVGANHLRDDLGVPPFKHPTGFYRSNIVPKREGEIWTITDSGVVYGPWLAGVGSRNAASRFKGYKHWRRLLQFLRKEAPTVANKQIGRIIRRYS